MADLRDGRFSLTDFCERRARPILPALFLVLAVTVPLAWLCQIALLFRPRENKTPPFLGSMSHNEK